MKESSRPPSVELLCTSLESQQGSKSMLSVDVLVWLDLYLGPFGTHLSKIAMIFTCFEELSSF